jgi:hypothetical protein
LGAVRFPAERRDDDQPRQYKGGNQQEETPANRSKRRFDGERGHERAVFSASARRWQLNTVGSWLIVGARPSASCRGFKHKHLLKLGRTEPMNERTMGFLSQLPCLAAGAW